MLSFVKSCQLLKSKTTVLRTEFRVNDFETSFPNGVDHAFSGLWPCKIIIAAVRKYWHNHRLVNSVGTKSNSAGTDAPFMGITLPSGFL